MESQPKSRRPQKEGKETYKKVSKLGEGSQGTVYKVKCGSDDSFAAIKQIKTNGMDKEELQDVLNEIKLL